MKTLLKIYYGLSEGYKMFAKTERNKKLKSYYEGKADAFADVVETIKILLDSEVKND